MQRLTIRDWHLKSWVKGPDKNGIKKVQRLTIRGWHSESSVKGPDKIILMNPGKRRE